MLRDCQIIFNCYGTLKMRMGPHLNCHHILDGNNLFVLKTLPMSIFLYVDMHITQAAFYWLLNKLSDMSFKHRFKFAIGIDTQPACHCIQCSLFLIL